LNRVIEAKLGNLPDSPGVYIMKDKNDQIIYIGKAVSLKNRVRQYFKASGHTGKVGAMVANIEDFEYILTDNEVEALILECNLIKKHRPKYNILLKDDKHYPYIMLTTEEDFPRIVMTRKISKDNNKYFGPYTSARAVRETIEVITRIFPIRTCSRDVREGKKDRPCLYYHIGQCPGPCLGNVKKEDYRSTIRDVCRFLEGRHDEIIRDLRFRMEQAAENLQFELAAVLRDKLNAVERIMENQKVISTAMEDQDVIAFAQADIDSITAAQIFFIRGGKLISAKHFILEGASESTLEDMASSFIKQFYSLSAYIPKEILLQTDIEDRPAIEQWLMQLKGSRVYIKCPKKGEKRKLVELARRNAAEALQAYTQKAEREKARTEGAVIELASRLGLPNPPYRMECYDISNIQGVEKVASMVVFENGVPVKKEYRRFKIKTVESANDFASMAEVISRRFKRGLEERKGLVSQGQDFSKGKFSKFPDLVIVDGGKGQLNAALEVMSRLGLDHIPVVGLAKEFEEIYTKDGGDPIVLPRSSNALHLMQRIRDEAHRFAITYHRSLRDKGSLHSALMDIPGIGPKRMKELIKAFGSIDAIKRADFDALVKVKGMNKRIAAAIATYLKD